MSELDIRLRAVTAADIDLFRRLATEPGLVGPNWYGFRDAEAAQRRFDTDGWLGPDDGRLMVAVDDDTAGLVSWFATGVALTKYWNIGITLLPDWRGRGVGWRAQAILCDYLFAHTPVERLEAGTQPDNIAEQKALVKAGFTHEGVLRSAAVLPDSIPTSSMECRAGAYRDVWVYGRLRSDPYP